MAKQRIVIDPDFKGYAQTYINEDGKCIYSGRSLEEMRAEDGIEYITPSDEEMDKLYNDYYKSLQKEWEDISEEYYYEMLEVLPPMNWRNIGSGVNVFCISEAYSGDLHAHFIKYKKGDQYVYKTALRSRFIKGDQILQELGL